MSDTKTETEPTMEEILASIRRIISEGDDEDESKKPEAPPPPDGAVLELTDEVNEDGTVVNLTATDQPDGESSPEPESVASVEPTEDAEMTTESPKDTVDFAAAPSEPPAPAAGAAMGERLVSEATAEAATATFAQLARSLAQDPATAGVTGDIVLGTGRTLEDLVKELIRPMLKDWLDHNLPQIVEQGVRRELDRMTRRAEDI